MSLFRSKAILVPSGDQSGVVAKPLVTLVTPLPSAFIVLMPVPSLLANAIFPLSPANVACAGAAQTSNAGTSTSIRPTARRLIALPSSGKPELLFGCMLPPYFGTLRQNARLPLDPLGSLAGRL